MDMLLLVHTSFDAAYARIFLSKFFIIFLVLGRFSHSRTDVEPPIPQGWVVRQQWYTFGNSMDPGEVLLSVTVWDKL